MLYTNCENPTGALAEINFVESRSEQTIQKRITDCYNEEEYKQGEKWDVGILQESIFLK